MMLRLAEASNVMLLMLFIISICSCFVTILLRSSSVFILSVIEWWMLALIDDTSVADEAYVQDISIQLVILLRHFVWNADYVRSMWYKRTVPRLLIPGQHRRLLTLLLLYALIFYFHRLLLGLVVLDG